MQREPLPQITEQDYRAAIRRTYAGPDTMQPKLTLAALGLAGEVGEVVDHVKKHLFQGHSIDLDHLKNELGDVLWYFSLACEACNFDLPDIMATNVAKLQKRYPNGFETERSMHREKLER